MHQRWEGRRERGKNSVAERRKNGKLSHRNDDGSYNESRFYHVHLPYSKILVQRRSNLGASLSDLGNWVSKQWIRDQEDTHLYQSLSYWYSFSFSVLDHDFVENLCICTCKMSNFFNNHQQTHLRCTLDYSWQRDREYQGWSIVTCRSKEPISTSPWIRGWLVDDLPLVYANDISVSKLRRSPSHDRLHNFRYPFFDNHSPVGTVQLECILCSTDY
jgi:hypothetical protein